MLGVCLHSEHLLRKIGPCDVDRTADVYRYNLGAKLGGVKGMATRARTDIEHQATSEALRRVGLRVVDKVLAPLLAKAAEALPLIGEGVGGLLLDITREVPRDRAELGCPLLESFERQRIINP